MAEEWDYGNDWGANYDPWYPEAGGSMGNMAWDQFIGWGDPTGPGSSGDTSYGGEAGGGNWLSSILGSLGGLSGVLGPALQAGGALAGGAIGSNASSDASRLQSEALNRGIDLSTSQWLQQLSRTQPWVQAGQESLSTLQGLAGREAPGVPGQIPTISGQGYALPAIAPTWGPQAYRGPQYGPGGFSNTKASGSGGYSTPGLTGGVNEQASTNFGDGMQTGGNMVQDASGNWVQSGAPQQSAFGPEGAAPSGGNWLTADMLRQGGAPVPWAGDYRWTPGQGPSAANYRYTPGQTPDAAQYQSGPPQLYQGAMPGTQVSQLTGQQVLDQDPGAAFRQSEARKALEGSAAARGGLLSGSTLGALQRQSQDLASQEYGNAWQRMMARDTEQYGRNWGQYQQAWNQGVQGTQLGLQTNAQNFGQALSASQLREQVNQVAAQQGWSQAQAEAAFREGLAQQASQQGYQQALAGQGQAWQQGLAGQQWEQQQRQAYDQSVYDRMMQQSQTQYGRDVSQNEQDYARQQAQYRQQLAQYLLPWEQNSTLAQLGAQVAGQLGNQGVASSSGISSLLGQLGSTQAMGTLGSAGQWNQAISGGVGGLQNILKGINA